MPFGDDCLKARRCVLFSTNSATNFSRGVDTSGVSVQASRHFSITGKYAGYSQSNISPVDGGCPA